MSTMVFAGIIPEWSLGDRLRKARELTGLERGEFATALGVSRNTVTNYEHGKVEPRRPVLLAWAMRSGVSLEWLEGRTGAPDSVPPAGIEPATNRLEGCTSRAIGAPDRRRVHRGLQIADRPNPAITDDRRLAAA